MWTSGSWISVQIVALALYALFSVSSTHYPYGNGDEGQASSIVGEKQVGKDGASTVFSIYNTSPESLDGKHIFYFRFKEEPADGRVLVPGELWICNRDLTGHRMISVINGMQAHNGPNAQWIDNNLIGLIDRGAVRVIDIRNGKDVLRKKIEASGIGHDSFEGRMLFTVPPSDKSRAAGIYELDCHSQKVRTVILHGDVTAAAIPSYIDRKSLYPFADWRLLHCQYSPDGKKIGLRIDLGNGPKLQLMGLCNSDGSDFEIQNKSLHFMWYDNESIIGHARFGDRGEKLSPEKHWVLMRWNLKGEYMETLGPRGNHLAASPDRKYFVSESLYQENPVFLKLIANGKAEDAVEIARFDPFSIVWEKRFHVNPSFSRDGKRVYYSKPLNDKYNGTFYYDIAGKD